MKSLFTLTIGFVTIMSLIINQMGGNVGQFWMQLVHAVANLF